MANSNNTCIKLLLIVSIVAVGILIAATDVYNTGGELLPEQAAYDVTFYRLDLVIDPDNRSIAGALTVSAGVISAIDSLVLDLDPVLAVDSIIITDRAALFTRVGGKLWIALPQPLNAGDSVTASIHYGGQPHVAENPPWGGGFNWSTTPSGTPWVGVSCEGEGADIWWPCKDHPSDEPDSMALHFTVPDNLECASNGHLRKVTDNADGTSTFNWFVSTPINNYNVTVNLAPYRIIDSTYTSITGEIIPVAFWSLPGNLTTAQGWFAELTNTLDFMETYFGPYPFRGDKYGVVQTAYLGMEHQSCISYGDDFTLNYYGFDYILTHETAHEWWGNLISAADWKDIWLHESFATYAEALCAEYLGGDQAYFNYVGRWTCQNYTPIAPYESQTFDEIYGHDIYHKGARILHTLRYLIGEDTLLEILRTMLYPTKEDESVTTGRHCRLVNTHEFITLAECLSSQDLGWFFELYLRQPELPTLVYSIDNGILSLRWDTPDDLPFPMPVEVIHGSDTTLVAMDNSQGALVVNDQSVTLDWRRWILKKGIVLEAGGQLAALPEKVVLRDNYPNPFNPITTIEYYIPSVGNVELAIYNLRGREVIKLVDTYSEPGHHSTTWSAENQPSGMYFYRLKTSFGIITKKMLVIK